MKRDYDFSGAKRGPVFRVEPGKTRIAICPDNAVLDWFRRKAHAAGGASYQNFIDEALTRHMGATQEPLEGAPWRVIREELRNAGRRK